MKLRIDIARLSEYCNIQIITVWYCNNYVIVYFLILSVMGIIISVLCNWKFWTWAKAQGRYMSRREIQYTWPVSSLYVSILSYKIPTPLWRQLWTIHMQRQTRIYQMKSCWPSLYSKVSFSWRRSFQSLANIRYPCILSIETTLQCSTAPSLQEACTNKTVMYVSFAVGQDDCSTISTVI